LARIVLLERPNQWLIGALKGDDTMTEDREIKNYEKLAERARTMKTYPKFFLTISICLAFSTAAFAGCKKEAEEPEPEVTTGAEAPPPEPEPVQIEQVRCELQRVYFAFDSAELDETARATIQEAVECFRGQGLQVGLMLTGACDPRGTEEYNIALGERRASVVREYMRSLGLNSRRVSITSVGEEMATGTDEASWAQDRNVNPSRE
jgi:peptidoglycan-associated lipoprotein